MSKKYIVEKEHKLIDTYNSPSHMRCPDGGAIVTQGPTSLKRIYGKTSNGELYLPQYEARPFSTLYRSDGYISVTGDKFYSKETYPFTNYNPREPRVVSKHLAVVRPIEDYTKYTDDY